MALTDEAEYGREQIQFLETLWGEGFLSPGGPDEVALVLDGVGSEGCDVLDIGCGTGGIDILLLREYGARRVTAVDIEPRVLERGRELAGKYGLSDRLEFVAIEPGPLPFDDGAFDFVFSKDAMIHIADKEELFRDVHRVLKPGGILAASDWMRRDENPPSKEMEAYIAAEGLSFAMASLPRYRAALEAAGFVDIEVRDRNAWYRQQARREMGALSGPLKERMVALVGEEDVEHAIDIWRKMLVVLESGEHRPGHFRGRKPRAGSVKSPSAPGEP